ncbi:hypothetical protein K504DRAFT_454237 [Pleomassaria siparia CBS 279.74]|uniref:Uncharacterized protein n=1 Tax=Pleomassaria siparia CBS 279.74 TaxID=1314801 RepID=A0A6G1JQN3_9PLEO|nr:hypothetical protein K504DRAFT_454237 [Pleomassaria siparia CBS 279.74]
MAFLFYTPVVVRGLEGLFPCYDLILEVVKSAAAARKAGACTLSNNLILLRVNAYKSEVWASLVASPTDWAPLGLDVVATWDAGIRGNILAEWYAFAYDALVEEAKGVSTSQA